MEMEQKPIPEEPIIPSEPSTLISNEDIQQTATEMAAEKKKEPEYPTTGSRIATYFLVLLAVVAVATVTIAIIVSNS